MFFTRSDSDIGHGIGAVNPAGGVIRRRQLDGAFPTPPVAGVTGFYLVFFLAVSGYDRVLLGLEGYGRGIGWVLLNSRFTQ